MLGTEQPWSSPCAIYRLPAFSQSEKMTTHCNPSLHGATFQPLAFCSPGGCTSQRNLTNVPSPQSQGHCLSVCSLESCLDCCKTFQGPSRLRCTQRRPPGRPALGHLPPQGSNLPSSTFEVPPLQPCPHCPCLSSFTRAEQSRSWSRCGNLAHSLLFPEALLPSLSPGLPSTPQ